jgi:hypothetical protein
MIALPNVALKACPFCGWRQAQVEAIEGVFCVECPDCCAAGPVEDTLENAVIAWNTRK